ncbi:MAG: hypothetical protein KAX39_01415 [candidate division Zixibacteria bacterium]|nr:hypothetical protein [candidate division Zixibacteria bacterium]
MKSNLFELGFVHLDDLIFHQTCDFNRVCRLADQIKRDGHLKNPVLVASFSNGSVGPVKNKPAGLSSEGSGKLLVLDGVNRISALKLLGFPDVLVQKVDLMDAKVELTSWNHLIFKIKKEQLIEKLKDLDLEISPCGWNWRKEALEDQRTICYLLFRDHSELVVSQRDSSAESRVKNLYRVIAIYSTSWEIYHPGSDEGLFSAFDSFENSSAMNILPVFKKEEVTDLVFRGILFPFGVTRFVIPQRVLGLEVSCSVLGDGASLSEKNLFLKELLSYRIKSKKTKFYEESVFLFNE